MIGLFIHLFDKSLFNEFALYCSLIDIVFPNNIILFNLENTEINKLFTKYVIKIKFPNAHIIYNENKGADIGGLFNQIRYIRENNIKLSWVLNIHSKKDSKWRTNLILPLISSDVFKFIKNNLENDKCGFIATRNYILIKDYDKDFPQNIKGVEKAGKIFSDIDINYKYFAAGTMFWINYNIIEKISDSMMAYFEKDFSYGKPKCNLNNKCIQPEFVFERVITGALCSKSINYYIKDDMITQLNDNFIGTLRL